MEYERLQKIIKVTYEVALAGPGAGLKNSYRLGATIYTKRNRILTSKFNSSKTHPLLAQYTNWPVQHAESAAILALGFDMCYDTRILVVRVKKNGGLAMAKPCRVCQAVIAEAGIRSVIYSTEHGFRFFSVATPERKV